MYKLENIRVRHGERTVLDLDSLELPTDRVTVILGHNGSGKSTMMNLLAQQNRPTEGQISLHGKKLESYGARQFARSAAFMPQRLPGTSGLTVNELVKLGRFPWRGLIGRWQQEDQVSVTEALQDTDISQYRDTLVDQLSGGERQRAWVSMLLAQNAPLLLLDEPTSALDLCHQYDLLTLLKRLNRERQRGVILILHDLNMALRFADHIVGLKQGKVAFQGSPTEIQDEAALSDLYSIPIRLLQHPEQEAPVAVIA